MLAVMSGNGNREADPIQDFLSTGRVGRRNAMANILSEHALTTTADLPEKLMSLTTEEGKEGENPQSCCMSTDDSQEDGGNEASGSSS